MILLTDAFFPRAAAAGWPGVILSDTLAVRPTCDISNFTKSLAVAGAQIVPRNAVPAPEGVPADIAARTDLVGAARLSVRAKLIPFAVPRTNACCRPSASQHKPGHSHGDRLRADGRI